MHTAKTSDRRHSLSTSCCSLVRTLTWPPKRGDALLTAGSSYSHFLTIGIFDAMMAMGVRSRCLLHALENSWAPGRSRRRIGSCSIGMLVGFAAEIAAGRLHARCSEHGAASGSALT